MRTTTLLALGATLGLAVPAMAQPGLAGDWLMEKNAGKVRMAPCAGKPDRMCGTIISIRPRDPSRPVKTRDGKPPPDPQSFIGQVIIADLKPDGPGKWSGGRFQFPGLSQKVSARVTLDGASSLRLKGCAAAVLCGEMDWQRAP